MTQPTVTLEIERDLHFMARCLYPWLKYMLTSWPILVKFIEDYTPILGYKVVKWIRASIGFKCNSDDASKGNSGPSSGAFFCIRNVEGNFVYAKVKRLEENNNLREKISAIKMGLKFCIAKELLHVTLETDSLIVKKMIDGEWEVPWSVSVEIRKIRHLMKEREIVIEHIFKKGNKVANFFS
ncbi:hypothetical protein RDI58_015048 [Solanum bulbocastanum]|uniref:RNase H type-1 domain-containing protein n=1 Tax=Solanum bulbocastanum TaxID=147425 RepID=A0AAN8YEL2_SOLBU